jgi:hypothetical protein
MLKPPPNWIDNIGAWEYVLAKLANKQADDGKQRVDEYGNPLNYGAAVAIYKHVVKKYPHLGKRNVGVAPVHVNDMHGEELSALNVLADKYPVGVEFWMDDVLCEAVEYRGGMAVFPDPEGFLFINAKVLDVDDLGQYRDWPVGKIFPAAPHRCASANEV